MATCGAFRVNRSLLCTLMAGLLTVPSFAQAVSCDGVGVVSVGPMHPSPGDAVRYGVTLPADPLGSGKPFRVWITHGPPVQTPTFEYRMTVGVFITEESNSAGFPLASPYPYSPMMGSFGPLPVGKYTVDAATAVFNETTKFFDVVCQPSVTTSFTVAAQAGPTSTSPVVEFYNPKLDHYFVTQSVSEIASLDAGGAWQRTGESFPMYTASGSDGRADAVYRYYGLPAAGLDSHFFTWNVLERDALDAGVLRKDWVKETDDAFEAITPDVVTGQCPAGTTAVYRLWNARADSAHRYTTSLVIKEQMIAKGYVAEGFGEAAVAMCSPMP